MRASPLHLALVIALCATSVSAFAASDELILAIEPGYDRLSASRSTRSGVGGTASAWLGLTDDLWLAASAGAFRGLDEDGDREGRSRYEAFGGIAAAFDVFRLVPYVEVLGGIVGAGGAVHPTVRIGLGADYLLSPEWGLGAVVRYRPLPERDIASSSLTAQLRLTYRLSW